MIIEGMRKLTLLDFPGRCAATLFTHGCNLRCPFCHNASLVTRAPESEITAAEVYAFLEKRTGLLDGVCITGGEPLINKEVFELMRGIRARGFAVKLDTNGFFRWQGCFPKGLPIMLQWISNPPRKAMPPQREYPISI